MIRIACAFLLSFLAMDAYADAPRWTTQLIDGAGAGSRKTAIRKDINGDTHVAYTGCLQNDCRFNVLKYARISGSGKWQTEILDRSDKDTGWFPTLEVKDDGSVHIFYANHLKYELNYIQSVGSGDQKKWKQKTMPGNGGWWASSVRKGDDIYVAHTKFPEPWGHDRAQLEVIRLQTGKEWSFEIVDPTFNTGWSPEINLTSSGLPVVSYNMNFPQGSLRIAEKSADGQWQITRLVDNAPFHSFAIDPLGALHLVYTEESGSIGKQLYTLFYATNRNNGWDHFQLDPDPENKSDKKSNNNQDVEMDKSGRLHMVFRDDYYRTFKYGRMVNGAWEYFTIDKMKESGLYPNMTIDNQGVIHATYERLGQIFYARCDNCIE